MQPSVSTQAVGLTATVEKKVVTPPATGTGMQDYIDWVNGGKPNYIPDDKPSKGIDKGSEQPVVTTVQVECDKPDLAGLTEHALATYHTVCALFPEISTFYGYRAGDQDHGTGNAIDCMVYGDSDTGEALASFLIDHADELNIKYIIWRQRIWQNLDGLRYWQTMEDRGSPTANHMDHVHISVN